MALLSDNWFQISLLMESGGLVLWLIAAASVLMWILIAERYVFVYWVYPRQLQAIVQDWHWRAERKSWYAQQIRKGLIAQSRAELERFLMSIQTLTVLLPMLGLLGTVHGMIQTFDVITVFGTGNARGMAGGISVALITTMGGLMTALSGLYFSTQLKQRVSWQIHNMADALRRE